MVDPPDAVANPPLGGVLADRGGRPGRQEADVGTRPCTAQDHVDDLVHAIAPRRRRRALIGSTLTVTTPAVSAGSTKPSPTSTPSTPGAAPAPGVLDWQPCTGAQFDRWEKVDDNSLDGFECSPFVRPLDRDRPKGEQVTLAVVRLQGHRPRLLVSGTLFLNPGGPGQSGIGLSKIVYLLPESVRASFDFVTYDPRGIGASTPALKGRRYNIPKPSRPATGKVNWSDVLTTRQKQVAAANAKCLEENQDLVEHGGTLDGAYDLDALRPSGR